MEVEDLSSRVGFLELERIKDILNKEEGLEENHLQEKLERKVKGMKKE